MNPGDKVIYIVQNDGYNPQRGKARNPHQYSYFGTIVKIKGTQAILDLMHPRTKRIVRRSGCPIRNIKVTIP